MAGGAVSINLNSDSISVGSIHIAADGAGIAALVIMRPFIPPGSHPCKNWCISSNVHWRYIPRNHHIYEYASMTCISMLLPCTDGIGDLLFAPSSIVRMPFSTLPTQSLFVNIQFSKIDRVCSHPVQWDTSYHSRYKVNLLFRAEIQTGKPIMIAGQLFPRL